MENIDTVIEGGYGPMAGLLNELDQMIDLAELESLATGTASSHTLSPVSQRLAESCVALVYDYLFVIRRGDRECDELRGLLAVALWELKN